MGKAQRIKGKQQEYKLRDYLRLRHWTADRVPSSGAAQGFPGDIKATKNGKTLLFELKSRKDTFKTVYELFYLHQKQCGEELLTFVFEGKLIAVSPSLEIILDHPNVYEFALNNKLYQHYARTFKKLANMEQWLRGSQVLVIKDDRQPYLFITIK